MNLVSLKQRNKKLVLTITNSKQMIIREITLIKDKEYIINPINKRFDKNRGRKVLFKSIESTKYGPIAKVKYLDTLRPGKVEIDALDHASSELQKKSAPVEDAIKPFVYDKVVPLFKLYLDILSVIDNKKNNENIAVITQKEIAGQVSTSPTNVSKKVKELVRYGGLEVISPGAYKLLFNSIWYTPYRIVHMVLNVISEHPEVVEKYDKQAVMLDVSLADIFQAWAFINLIDLDDN